MRRFIKPARAAFLVFGLALAATHASADFKDDYTSGVKAADKANWANARAKMQSALASEPNPQARVRLYGMVFSAYIPHYYLALASFKLGDCAGAKVALSNSANVAIMQQAKGLEAELAQSKLILAQCGASPSVPAAPVPKPIETIATTPNISEADATRAQAQAQAQAKAQAQAQEHLAIERRQREAKIAADTLAAQQARAAAPIAPTSPPPVVKVPAPAALTSIASSYFSGNLPEAARASVATLTGKALAHALLLRAAAKHGIYLQQGAKNAQQLIDLKADLTSAKRADASAKPTARYFNRDFISLYATP